MQNFKPGEDREKKQKKVKGREETQSEASKHAPARRPPRCRRTPYSPTLRRGKASARCCLRRRGPLRSTITKTKKKGKVSIESITGRRRGEEGRREVGSDSTPQRRRSRDREADNENATERTLSRPSRPRGGSTVLLGLALSLSVVVNVFAFVF